MADNFWLALERKKRKKKEKKAKMSIATGRYTEFLIMVVTAIATYYFLWMAVRGKPQELREMPQIDAISDAVDRGVETGRPVYCSPGDMAYLSGMYAPMTIAGMNVIRYTARLAVRKGARIILPVPCNPEAMPLIDGIFREVCVAEGKPEAYKRDDVIYYGVDQSHHSMGLTATIAREGCAAAVFCGATRGGGTNSPAGWAREFGGIVIGGTARYLHQGSWAMLADYPAFMDDTNAMGAVASGDDVVKASLVGGDIVKLVIVAFVIVAIILAAAGLPVVTPKTGWIFQ